MITPVEHISQAEHNEALFEHLNTFLPSHGDWQVTLLFYTTLHYVDAWLHQVRPPTGIHPGGHRERARYVATYLGAPMARDYLRLQQRSENARYDGNRFTTAEVAILYAGEFDRIRVHIRAALGLPL